MRQTVALRSHADNAARDVVRLGAAGGVLIALVGACVLLGWMLDVSALKTVATGLASMKVNSALGFLFAGLALAVAGFAPARHGLRLMLAAVPLVLGVTALLQYALGTDFGIDQLLFADPASKLWPGRMSPSTAVNMVLLGLGIMLVPADQPALRYAAEFIKLTGTLHALLALLGYLYNVSAFYAVTPYSSVALHTAVAFFVAFVAVYCLRPAVGIAGLISAENAGGVLARRLLASAVIAPVVIGLVVVRGIQTQSYSTDFALAVFTIANIVALAAVVLHTAHQIGGIDEVRIRAIDELRAMNNQVQTTLRETDLLLVELRRNEERFRTIADTAPMAVLIARVADDAVLYANAAFARSFGYAMDDIGTLRTRGIYMNPDDQDAVLARAESGEANSMQLRMRRADGSAIWVVLNAGQTRILGETSVILSLVDITELRKAQEELNQTQKMDVVGQLAGGIAHDLNNLLHVVINQAADLRDALGNPADRELAETVVQAGERSAVLIQRLLALSSRQLPKPTRFSLNSAVESMLGFLHRTLGEHIRIDTRLAPGLEAVVADRWRLETALLNLAVNARDAMPNGGTLTIETADAMFSGDEVLALDGLPSGAYAMLAVGDTGIGIAPATLTRVFEPLFTTKDAGQNAGLGLSTIRDFAKQAAGHVAIESEHGRGTTVRLYLPYARRTARAEPAPMLAEAAAPPLAPRGGGATVLVVEDNVIVRAMIRAMLADLGYQVLEAATGKDALLALAAAGGKIDALLTDMVLPGGMGGTEIAAALCQRAPSIKVVMMTGYAPEAVMRRNGHGEGNTILLNKPFCKAELADALARAMADEGLRALA